MGIILYKIEKYTMGSALVHPKYRQDIDGLRAVAVLSVVAFHAFPYWLKGGFIGVDVFFVISGFLISTIILKSLDNSRFSFFEFYIRRIKRIFPALILVLSACFAFGWFSLLADEYRQLGKHMAGGAGFVSNLILWSESGYFDNAAEFKPLLHLWSLGVEEQFYIVWPLVLWIAYRLRLNLLTISLVFGFSSFLLNIDKVYVSSVGAFYSPLTRFWELLAGSVLAWILLYRNKSFPNFLYRLDLVLISVIYAGPVARDGRTLANSVSAAGFGLLVFGFCFMSKDLIFPGYWAGVPVLGAVLIILAGSKAWINRKILSNKVLVWFGLISFPLYLWHWPLLAFARILEGDMPSRNIRIGAVLLAVVLAWLTYRFVERPIRGEGRSLTKAALLAVIMIIVGLLGCLTYIKNGFEFRVADFKKISQAAGEWLYPGDMTRFKFGERYFLRLKSETDDETLYVGDSNIEQYFVRIEHLVSTEPRITNSAVFATGGGCMPVPEAPYDSAHKHCVGFTESAELYAKENFKVKAVVIGAQWNYYFLYGNYLDGKFGVGGADYITSLKKLGKYVADLKGMGKKVFVVLNIPVGKELDPKYMAVRGLEYFPNVIKYRAGGISRSQVDGMYAQIQSDLKMVAEQNGATVISPMDYLCDSSTCPSVDRDGEPLYKDATHLRSSYSKYHADFMDATILR